MKGMKGRILKKLKSIRPVVLKQDRVLQLYASDGLASMPPDSGQISWNPSVHRKEPEKSDHCKKLSETEEPEIIDIDELMRDLDDEEKHYSSTNDKENIRPLTTPNPKISMPDKRSEKPLSSESGTGARNIRHGPLTELDMSSFRRPDPNSGSLFDPDLLAAFERVVMEHIRTHEAETKSRESPPKIDDSPAETRRQDDNPLSEFEERCPPRGADSVVLYTTSLGAIRKTFEDCNRVRFVLKSLRILIDERDVSMHSEFREELRRVLDRRDVIPPELFVMGRYIGGAEEVLGLHEQGKLLRLVRGIPACTTNGPCDVCGGIRFVLCSECNGSCKLIADDDSHVGVIRCPQCNENGLMLCPICC